MLTTTFKRTLLATVLAAACGAANAGVLTFQGVTFTTSTQANILTLEIDAAHPTGDWAKATTIGALELKNVGAFDDVQLVQAPGAAAGWSLGENELNAKGCTGAARPNSAACYAGTHVALTDDMVFRFAFSGAGLDLDEPSLKVNFFVGDGTRKVGSLLSQTIPAAEVPPPTPVSEPRSAAMLLGGLAVMGLIQRRKRK